MNTQMTRPKRPKLYLPFALDRDAGNQPIRTPQVARRSGILPDQELRRLVAQMVG